MDCFYFVLIFHWTQDRCWKLKTNKYPKFKDTENASLASDAFQTKHNNGDYLGGDYVGQQRYDNDNNNDGNLGGDHVGQRTKAEHLATVYRQVDCLESV